MNKKVITRVVIVVIIIFLFWSAYENREDIKHGWQDALNNDVHTNK